LGKAYTYLRTSFPPRTLSSPREGSLNSIQRKMPRKLCGKPMASLFSFSTPVFINIQDERLGILHYVLMLGLVGYVIIYQIFYEGLHLKTEPPLGSVSFQLKRPTVVADVDWWNASDAGRVTSNSSFKTPSVLSYCLGTLVPPAIQQRNCRYLDEEDIAQIIGGTCVVSTRVSTMTQQLLCVRPPSINESCVNIYQPLTSESWFVVEPEEYEVMLDHEVFTATTGVYGKANDPAAVSTLRMLDGTAVHPADGSGYQRIFYRDTLTIKQLMLAAGVTSLDMASQGLFDTNSTLRYTGITILLKIKYSNYQPWGFVQGPVTYEYEVSQGNVYQAHHKTFMLDNVTRMFENRHGITISVAQIGKLSSFDPLSLTTFFASALALLTITNVIVDRIALWFLREGKMYEKAKYMQTETRDDIAEFLQHRKQEGKGEIQDYDTFREELKHFLDDRGGAATPLLTKS